MCGCQGDIAAAGAAADFAEALPRNHADSQTVC